MLFTKTTLDDCVLIQPEPVRDERGSFSRTFCTETFAANGLESGFVQHSRSFNLRKGTLRGMHYQAEPHTEAKLVTCLKGGIFDVVIDLRPHSPTFRRWQGFELTATNQHQLFIPRGFAHGFQTLEDESEVFYLISNFYEPSAARGVHHADPAFSIPWPLPVAVISERDRGWPVFEPDTALT